MNGNLISWSPGTTLEEVEKQVILKAFQHYRGNKTTTSHALGISIRTLDNKLEKYQNDGKEQQAREDAGRVERDKFLARQRGQVIRDEATGADVYGPASGSRVESAPETSAQLDMPMPKRAQVQAVLPAHASKSGTGKNR